MKRSRRRGGNGNKEIEQEGGGLALFTIHVMLCKTPSVSQLPSRDDAGRFDTNRIGPKKRLTYETGSEKEI